MYIFDCLLPLLEPDYRRKLCFSLQIGYQMALRDPDNISREDFNEIRSLYQSVQAYDMSKLEATGRTNTGRNPFDVL